MTYKSLKSFQIKLEDDIVDMIETYRNALKSKYQHINDSIQHTREIARNSKEFGKLGWFI